MRKLLLTILMLAAIIGLLVNVWHQTGFTPFGSRHFIEEAHRWFAYARFVAIPVALFAFFYQRGQPAKTLAWVALMLGLPFAGTIIYLFFGLNMRQDLKFRRKQKLDQSSMAAYEELLKDKTSKRLFATLIESRPGFALERQRDLVAKTTGANPSSAYDYCVFHDGDTLFDQLLTDIQQAKHHIHLEYFHFEDDWLGERISNALRQKAQEGVEVRIIFDAVGSRRTSKKFWRKLEKGGVEVAPFFQVRFRHLANSINYRNHRKIVVIDGTIGYTGGFNIAKEYIEGIDDLKEHWRDTHVRMMGPAVSHLQLTFTFDWRFSRDRKLEGEHYFPSSFPYEGTIPVQVASSGPDTSRNNIKYAYFNLLTRAEKYVYLVTPYFTPDSSVLTAMKTAALAGIDVRLMLPERSDSLFVTLASNSYIDELLDYGVKVYHYTRGMLHSKVVVADDIVTSIGTANMDERSHDLNFEINAMFYDEKLARNEREVLEKEMELYCKALTFENWSKPKIHIRLARGFARVFSPLL